MGTAFIFNADDYGLTPGVSRGIREAHRRGVVTSTTALMNSPYVERALRDALAETPRLGLGVHLVLTAGRPVLPPEEVPTLVDDAGRFRRLLAQTAAVHRLAPDEVRAEWRAQVESFVAVTGRPPDHLDIHHHFGYFTPALFRLLLELAREYGSAIRYPLADAPEVVPAPLRATVCAAAPALLAEFAPRCPDAFFGGFYGGAATRATLRRLLDEPRSGVVEVMCHPAFIDAELRAVSSYQEPRRRELEVLIAAREWFPPDGLLRFGDLDGRPKRGSVTAPT